MNKKGQGCSIFKLLLLAIVAIVIFAFLFQMANQIMFPQNTEYQKEEWCNELKCLEMCQNPGEDWTGFCINPYGYDYVDQWVNYKKIEIKDINGNILDVFDIKNCSERIFIETRECNEEE